MSLSSPDRVMVFELEEDPAEKENLIKENVEKLPIEEQEDKHNFWLDL